MGRTPSGSPDVDVAEEKIKERLGKHAGGDWTERNLVRIGSDQGHGGSEGVFFYFLTGSPPKGYAVYVPRLRLLSSHDARGERFRIMDEIVEVKDWQKTVVLRVDTQGGK